MRFTKKIFAGFTSAAIAAAMFAIPASAVKKGYQEFEPTADNVKIYGRTSYQNGALWVPWSAGGVEFKVKGATEGSIARFNLGKSQTTRVAVYVDGQLVTMGNTSSSATAPVIDVKLNEGDNVVKLVKLSESANSVLIIDSIEVEQGATIEPTAAKEHSIEFIGDSITCGYGVDGTLKESFSTKNENAAKTYAYLTAGLFDADYSFVSVSGTGIISGYTPSPDAKNENLLAPNYYENLCFTWNWIDGQNPSDLKWDFSESDHDAVVINLGTNDNSYVQGDEAKGKEFQDKYVEFLKTVRKDNPDAQIFCVLGLMGDELFPKIEAAVEQFKEETGDTKVCAHKLSLQNSNDWGYGVDYHPAEGSHLEASAELLKIISEDLGWKFGVIDEEGMANTDKADDVEYVNAPEDEEKEEEESSSESQAEESSNTESSEADSSAASSSKADSKAASGNTTSNPSTGAMLALAGVAIAGAAVVTAKKHD